MLFVYYAFVNQRQQALERPLRRTLQQLYVTQQQKTRCQATGFYFFKLIVLNAFKNRLSFF
ncbi:MAG: hypothetical protein EAZ16_05590 [Sphingobacteriales bacterium]|nr:MAG: hypothetical protein EAZ16_05590 [Sphingobacteriales bacterium]